jgi:tRNA G18 (ribose-2'-O)-methylase SpoU
MYNHDMPNQSYEIRVCTSCGLRYPLMVGHAFGTRCPSCMGNTRLVLSRKLVTEPGPARPGGTFVKSARKSLLRNHDGSAEMNEGQRGVFAVLLDNIRSAMNVGSILRSADGFGFRHVYLCGITTTPESEAVTKTSLGAEDTVPWSYHKDAAKLVQGLKREGWRVLALEDDARAASLHEESSRMKQESTKGNVVLIVGSEVTGVDPALLDMCDRILYIPMYGEKRSFNVAVAFGVAAYALHE